MDPTLKQLLQELVDTSAELARVREQLRLMQADYSDLKGKTEKVSGANKGI